MSLKSIMERQQRKEQKTKIMLGESSSNRKQIFVLGSIYKYLCGGGNNKSGLLVSGNLPVARTLPPRGRK